MFFLIFYLNFHNQEKGWLRFSSLANPSTNWMEEARSLAACYQDPFLPNGFRLTPFIPAALSCLYLTGPGKICKWNGVLHSRQSPSSSSCFQVAVGLLLKMLKKRRSGVFIVNCEHISHLSHLFEFEQLNVS